MDDLIDEDSFVFPFRKIEVWQLSVDLADFVIGLLESFPPNKHFRIIGQMEAAVSGISQNIAEGKGRQYNKEFIQFLYIAIGSLFEVLTLTEIFKRRKFFKEKEASQIRNKAKIIYRKTAALIRSLKRRV
jgi:four helix bundle protein